MATPPKLGDKCKGSEIGRAANSLYFWTECPACHVQRWVTVNNHKFAPESERKGLYRRCLECSKTVRVGWRIGPRRLPSKVFK